MKSDFVNLDVLISDLRAARLPEPEIRRALRVGAGLSIRQLSRTLGVTATTLSRWEYGATPALPNAIKYRAALDALVCFYERS